MNLWQDGHNPQADTNFSLYANSNIWKYGELWVGFDTDFKRFALKFTQPPGEIEIEIEIELEDESRYFKILILEMGIAWAKVSINLLHTGP